MKKVTKTYSMNGEVYTSMMAIARALGKKRIYKSDFEKYGITEVISSKEEAGEVATEILKDLVNEVKAESEPVKGAEVKEVPTEPVEEEVEKVKVKPWKLRPEEMDDVEDEEQIVPRRRARKPLKKEEKKASTEEIKEGLREGKNTLPPLDLSSIEDINISDKTGSEKQKNYAESLVENVQVAVADVLTRDIPSDGRYVKDSTGDTIIIYPDDVDAVKASYEFFKFTIESKKSCGEIIDVLKVRGVIDMAKANIKMAAKSHGQSPMEFVSNLINPKEATKEATVSESAEKKVEEKAEEKVSTKKEESKEVKKTTTRRRKMVGTPEEIDEVYNNLGNVDFHQLKLQVKKFTMEALEELAKKAGAENLWENITHAPIRRMRLLMEIKAIYFPTADSMTKPRSEWRKVDLKDMLTLAVAKELDFQRSDDERIQRMVLVMALKAAGLHAQDLLPQED